MKWFFIVSIVSDFGCSVDIEQITTGSKAACLEAQAVIAHMGGGSAVTMSHCMEYNLEADSRVTPEVDINE